MPRRQARLTAREPRHLLRRLEGGAGQDCRTPVPLGEGPGRTGRELASSCHAIDIAAYCTNKGESLSGSLGEGERCGTLRVIAGFEGSGEVR